MDGRSARHASMFAASWSDGKISCGSVSMSWLARRRVVGGTARAALPDRLPLLAGLAPAGSGHPPGVHLRAFDAERERVVDFLTASCREGRLEHDELDVRAARALRGRCGRPRGASSRRLWRICPEARRPCRPRGAAVVARAPSAWRVVPAVLGLLVLLLVLVLILEPAFLLYLGLASGFLVVTASSCSCSGSG